MRKQYIFAIFLIFANVCKNANASIGSYLLIGTTTTNYVDKKYVSFKDKNGKEYKIPRHILSQKQNAIASREPVVLYKEISEKKYLSYRQDCKKYFKDEASTNSKMTKNRSLASDKSRSCL